jgi:hypothetical protein
MIHIHKIHNLLKSQSCVFMIHILFCNSIYIYIYIYEQRNPHKLRTCLIHWTIPNICRIISATKHLFLRRPIYLSHRHCPRIHQSLHQQRIVCMVIRTSVFVYDPPRLHFHPTFHGQTNTQLSVLLLISYRNRRGRVSLH